MFSYILNFGPQHPAAHGVLRLILELRGEKIISLDPHIGFLHRGTEKLIEEKTFDQAIPYFDRLDYVSMLAQEHSFILAIEKLLNLKISLKIKYYRVLLDEITRLLNHIMCITTHALDVGALTPFLWGFEEREKLMSFYENLSGSRMHAAYYRVGGVWRDLNDNFLLDLYYFSLNFLNFLNALHELLTSNAIWISRLKNIGYLSKKNAILYSSTGPVMRGSGIPWDIRKIWPYETYNKIPFKLSIGKTSDAYSRYLVRFFEMKESVYIILTAINQLFLLKSKITKTELNDNIYHNKSLIKQNMEELILHFISFSEGYTVPKGVVYSSIEAPKGETGVLLKSTGTNKPYRCKIKSPGFMHLQLLEMISKNHLLADLVTNIGSIDIVFGEIDR